MLIFQRTLVSVCARLFMSTDANLTLAASVLIFQHTLVSVCARLFMSTDANLTLAASVLIFRHTLVSVCAHSPISYTTVTEIY